MHTPQPHTCTQPSKQLPDGEFLKENHVFPHISSPVSPVPQPSWHQSCWQVTGGRLAAHGPAVTHPVAIGAALPVKGEESHPEAAESVARMGGAGCQQTLSTLSLHPTRQDSTPAQGGGTGQGPDPLSSGCRGRPHWARKGHRKQTLSDGFRTWAGTWERGGWLPSGQGWPPGVN